MVMLIFFPKTSNTKKYILFLKEKATNKCHFAVSMFLYWMVRYWIIKERKVSFSIFLHRVFLHGPLPPRPGPKANAISTSFQAHY